MNFDGLYKEKLISAEKIADMIQDNWVCGMDIAGSIPVGLANEIAKASKKNKFRDIKMHMLLDLLPLDFLKEGYENIKPVSWFSGGALRKAVNEGRSELMPCYYRDMPQLMEEFIDYDAIFLHVSPMDKHGFFSMPLSGSFSQALLNKTKRIFLQVNENLPRSLYSPLIHISQVDGICEITEPLIELPPTVIDDTSKTIGAFIAEMVPNGATLQLGIGAVPDAVGLALKDKRNLGIHTELFGDVMVELIEAGAVTNMEKPIHKGKTVATLAFGTQRVYDYIDDNRAFEMLTVDYVNDPAVIAKHPNFISINAAIEVDFYGQVCSESIGTKHMSGSGGQADYVRGATQSVGGKSFIALPSTAMDGKISRISPTLAPGSIVTTHKNDVDYIVTEFGVAKLRGKTVSQRTRALIDIAHPDFRENLTKEARKMNIL